MKNISPRNIPGFRNVRENPDLWAVALLALALLGAQSPTAGALRAAAERELLSRTHAAAPWSGMDGGLFSGTAPAYRLRQVVDRNEQIAERDDASFLELSVEEWAARLDQKRAKLWNRLELKMRQLEQRIERQQGRTKFRSIATRSE